VLGYTSIFIVPSWNMMRRSREYIWLNGHRKTRHSKIQLSNQNISFNAITLNCEQKALRQVLLSFLYYIFFIVSIIAQTVIDWLNVQEFLFVVFFSKYIHFHTYLQIAYLWLYIMILYIDCIIIYRSQRLMDNYHM
jgi:hypothetical protein